MRITGTKENIPIIGQTNKRSGSRVEDIPQMKTPRVLPFPTIFDVGDDELRFKRAVSRFNSPEGQVSAFTDKGLKAEFGAP